MTVPKRPNVQCAGLIFIDQGAIGRARYVARIGSLVVIVNMLGDRWEAIVGGEWRGDLIMPLAVGEGNTLETAVANMRQNYRTGAEWLCGGGGVS